MAIPLRFFCLGPLSKWLTRYALAASAALLEGCAGFSGSGLQPGSATLEEVIATMGAPAMRWTRDDRGAQLSYPRGPGALYSYMVHVAPDGRLERIENVMDSKVFARIRPGFTKDDVLRTVGPPVPGWEVYFPARRELAWEWRYCTGLGMSARYHVLFDGDTDTVRSTMTFDESCSEGGCLCH